MLQELHGIYPVVYKDRILVPGECTFLLLLCNLGVSLCYTCVYFLTFLFVGGCPNTDRGVSDYFLVYQPE